MQRSQLLLYYGNTLHLYLRRGTGVSGPHSGYSSPSGPKWREILDCPLPNQARNYGLAAIFRWHCRNMILQPRLCMAGQSLTTYAVSATPSATQVSVSGRPWTNPGGLCWPGCWCGINWRPSLKLRSAWSTNYLVPPADATAAETCSGIDTREWRQRGMPEAKPAERNRGRKGPRWRPTLFTSLDAIGRPSVNIAALLHLVQLPWNPPAQSHMKDSFHQHLQSYYTIKAKDWTRFYSTYLVFLPCAMAGWQHGYYVNDARWGDAIPRSVCTPTRILPG